MKTILILPLFGLVLFSASCRTEAPLDPMTMKPSDRCMPHNASAVSHSSK